MKLCLESIVLEHSEKNAFCIEIHSLVITF